MNVRRMVMLMLVLGCLVQGVSAYTETVTEWNELFSNSYYNGSHYSYSVMYNATYTPGTSYYIKGWSYPTVNERFMLPISSGSTGDYVSGSGVITLSPVGGYYRKVLSYCLNAPECSWNHPELMYYTASDTPPSLASGESCIQNSTFTYYVDGVKMASSVGNYSFSIFNGTYYQIHHSETDVWHNFTATASDHSWNPSCPGTYTVSGTLLGPDGEGTNNALMALMYVQPPDPDNVTAANTEASYSSSTGEYSFSNIYPGAYFVVACGPGPCYPYGSEWFYVTDSDVTVTNLTYPEKINIRFRVLDANSTPQSGLYLHLQDAPSDYGGWMSTDADGYTSYNQMYPSAIYVEIVDGDATTLATTTITGNAQYEYQVSTITLPAPDANNTTVPVIPPASNNSTPPTQPPAGGGDIGGGTTTDPGDYACTNTLTANVQDADHVAIEGASVKLYPYNSSISGSHTGITDAAGEYTFPCTNATLSYNVETRATCYEHDIAENEGYSGTAYIHLNKTLTLACGFDDGSSGGGTGTNGTDGGDPDLIAESTVSDDTMKAPIVNYLWGGFLLVIFYMVATFYKRK